MRCSSSTLWILLRACEKNEKFIVFLVGKTSHLLVYFYGILGIFIAFSNASNIQCKE